MPWTDSQPDLEIATARRYFLGGVLGVSVVAMTVCGLAALTRYRHDDLVWWLMGSMFLSGIGVDMAIHGKYICKTSHLPTGEDVYGIRGNHGRRDQGQVNQDESSEQ